MEMLVSIIIPVFNVRDYVAEAIESVLIQDYINTEIIIIDDGSTDGSGDICDIFSKKDERICVIHQENKGLSTARNVGLSVARGEVIAFLDSDDAFHPNAISTLVKIMEEQQTDIVVCDFSIHDVQGKMISKLPQVQQINPRVIEQTAAFREILHGYIDTAPWNKLYRKEIWDNLRFPDGYIYEGTYLFFDILSRAKSVAMTDAKLIMHRNRSGSICNTRSLKHIVDGEYAQAHYCDFIINHTPDVFSHDEQKNIMQNRIKGLISKLLFYSYTSSDDHTGIATLRSLLIKPDIKMGVKESDVFIRMMYFFVIKLPGFADLAYSLFRRYKSRVNNAEEFTDCLVRDNADQWIRKEVS